MQLLLCGAPPRTLMTVSHFYRDESMPCQLSASEGQDQRQVCSPRSLWDVSSQYQGQKRGVTIPRLPIFHIASGYVYFFLDMADGEILKVQRITQYYSIAELFVYYCYFRAGSALWHPHYVFHFKLPSDMWFWRLSGKKMLFALLQNPAKYSPNAFSPNLNINKIYDCLPRRIYCCWL